MPSPYNRRTALQIVGTSVALALAGCAANYDPEKSNESPNQTSTPITTDGVKFDIRVEEQFTDNHPARIHAALTNTTEMPMTLFTGATPPFTSYLSGGASDKNRLILIPNVSEDKNPVNWIGETDPIPTTAENQCWNVTQDVVIDLLGMSKELEPGETSSQQYAVYGYQNETCLPPGTYRFDENTTLHRGRPSKETPTFGLKLGFTLTLNKEQSLSVKRHESTVSRHEY